MQDAAHDREVARLRAENAMLREVGLELAQKRNVGELLGRILAHARAATNADAGSVYVVADQGRRAVFAAAQNDSRDVEAKSIELPVDGTSLVGHCVLGRRPIAVPDAYALDVPGEGNNPWGVRHNRAFDIEYDYQTRSVLCVPMISARGDVIGVIQLINRRQEGISKLLGAVTIARDVRAFSEEDTELAASLAAQAGIALENAQLYQEVRVLFDGFVHASVTAIEQRDPTTSGHSERVAILTVALADACAARGMFAWSGDDRTAVKYAALLHDFGKVGVREAILVKAKKLFDHERDRIEQRIIRARLARELAAERAQTALLLAGATRRDATIDATLAREIERLDSVWQAVLVANEPTLLPTATRDSLREFETLTFDDERGQRNALLTTEELAALQITQGSLRADERDAINAHVSHTYQFLNAIPWSRELRQVPEIAWAHHEKLNGSGYPRGIGGSTIPAPSRVLAICDVFDALTARDRPYKKSAPLERALDILKAERDAGALDSQFVEIFTHERIWEALGDTKGVS